MIKIRTQLVVRIDAGCSGKGTFDPRAAPFEPLELTSLRRGVSFSRTMECSMVVKIGAALAEA